LIIEIDIATSNTKGSNVSWLKSQIFQLCQHLKQSFHLSMHCLTWKKT